MKTGIVPLSVTLEAEKIEVMTKPRRGGMWFEVAVTQKSGVVIYFRAKHYSMTTGGVEVFKK